MKTIPVLKPSYDDSVKEALLEVLDSGWTAFGPKVTEFEKKFAEKVGAKYCIATNSGTSALDLCLKAYNIKGGELITTPLTFVSDAIVGEWNDMDVTFADVDETTLCLDPKSIVASQDTKAVIAVNLHGRLADIDEIRAMSRVSVDSSGLVSNEPLIIEDNAHAMYTPGAGHKGDIAIWSFQAVKTMPIFDGGAVTTNDEKIYKKIRSLTWLGIEKNTYDRSEGTRYQWDYDIKQADGIKAYMTNVQAVIGLSQLDRLDDMLAKRRAIQTVYNEAFRDMPQIKLFPNSHTVQYYTAQCERRNELSVFLADKGVSTGVHFKPLSEMSYWKKAVKRPLPVTDRIWQNLLSFPVFYDMTWSEVEYVIACVKEFYEA